jgi:hypothetical protein
MMTKEQIAELLEIARSDPATWEALKARELETEKALADAERQGRDLDDPEAVLDPWLRPPREEILSQIVEKKYGKDHNLYYGSLVIAVRREVRSELGLMT